jgi:hypothetical protein
MVDQELDRQVNIAGCNLRLVPLNVDDDGASGKSATPGDLIGTIVSAGKDAFPNRLDDRDNFRVLGPDDDLLASVARSGPIDRMLIRGFRFRQQPPGAVDASYRNDDDAKLNIATILVVRIVHHTLTVSPKFDLAAGLRPFIRPEDFSVAESFDTAR